MNAPAPIPAPPDAYIIRNARYALTQVQMAGATLGAQERSMALQALAFALSRAAVWPQARDLLLTLAPIMATAATPELWQSFLEKGLARSVASDDARTQIALHLHLGELLQQMGRHQQALEHFDAALPLARRQQRQRWQARLLNRRGESLRRMQRWPQAEQAVHAALALLAEDDWAEQGYAAIALGAIHHDQRQWQQMWRHFRRGVQCWRHNGDERQMAKALVNLGVAATRLGRIAQAETHYRQAIALLETSPDPPTLAIARMNLGAMLTDGNRAQEGLDYLRQAEVWFRAQQASSRQAMIATNLGRAYYELQRWPQAAEAFRASRDLWQELGGHAQALNASAGLAAAWVQMGDLPQARAIVQEGQKSLAALPSPARRNFLQDVFQQVQEMIEKA